jgi:Ala-tRNA(Pro) deacylase
MPAAKLKDFLNREKVKFVSITHSVAYTAQEIAWITHTPGKELAKTVMVKIDGALAMAVLPASYHVDLSRLKAAAGASAISVATEREFRSQFPDCETGAMPPFGNLYNMTVYAEESLAADKEIAFNAGTHRELIRISYEDFNRLVQPVVCQFAAGSSVSATA